MKRPITALLLSGLILPGLGQLYLGRRTKGIALIMLINLLLMVSLFFVMKLASPVIAAHLAGAPLSPQLVLCQLQPYSFWGKLLLGAIVGLWGFGVMDLFSAFKASDQATDN
jgi:hypothetical protein